MYIEVIILEAARQQVKILLLCFQAITINTIKAMQQTQLEYTNVFGRDYFKGNATAIKDSAPLHLTNAVNIMKAMQ